ncbi:MAG: glycine oxidase ThiO [Gemmatimonadales bacterium]|nr:MAG: glycine oxidase ThiO [Gemmatimonadales bacterium]
MSDLIIVGGGIIGLSTAREAAIRGLSVTLLERGRPGREASWAAAGMLSPLAEASADGPFLDFALASLRRYRSWVAAIEEESGRTVEYRESGKLRLALSVRERGLLEQRREWASARGLHARWFEPAELREKEPGLSLSVQGALLIEEDFRVDNRRLAEALVEAAREAGVRIQSGVEVEAIEHRGGRVLGVRTAEGDSISGDRVLIAAGAWSGALQGLPRPIAVTPVRGQMLALGTEGPFSERVLESEEVYLIPRDDGRLLVGATVEEVGFEPGITAAGIRSLLEGALRLVPGLGSAPIVEFWSGFRPGTPDGHPILGPSPEVDGLFWATGHFRNGILLAPLTAVVLAAAIAGGDGPRIPEAFAADRPALASIPEPSG